LKATQYFNHAYDIAFSLVSPDPDGDIPASELRQAILRRLNTLDDDELIEAVGAPFDSFEIVCDNSTTCTRPGAT